MRKRIDFHWFRLSFDETDVNRSIEEKRLIWFDSMLILVILMSISPLNSLIYRDEILLEENFLDETDQRFNRTSNPYGSLIRCDYLWVEKTNRFSNDLKSLSTLNRFDDLFLPDHPNIINVNRLKIYMKMIVDLVKWHRIEFVSFKRRFSFEFSLRNVTVVVLEEKNPLKSIRRRFFVKFIRVSFVREIELFLNETFRVSNTLLIIFFRHCFIRFFWVYLLLIDIH